MKTIKENIKNLMERIEFPAEAQQELLRAFDTIAADPVAAVWWKRLVAQYEETVNCDYVKILADAKALGEALDIHEYTSHMLLSLAFGKKLLERYREKGVDESIYYASMCDLRYKLEECRLIHGKVGTFVASWFPGWFKMTRFALGRLQFEMTTLKDSYEVDGIILPEGAKAIDIHIPRTGTKMDHDAVLEAYRMAVEMFGAQFGDGPVVFTCWSWMLDPWHETVLSPNSNMVAFLRDFKIVQQNSYPNYSGVWRIFDCPFTGDIDALPYDTSLRRAYVDKMRSGEPTGWGRGLFIWRDGAICH